MNPYGEYGLYIAGPQCFYPRGYSQWHAYRKLAEFYGFTVVLPNDIPLAMDHEDLRLNAGAIFANLKTVIEETSIMIADLEYFRGSNPDGGTVFELGMAYAKGARLYGYTRDKRATVHKDQRYFNPAGGMEPESVYYEDLPFAPSVTASTVIVEGGFEECLKVVMLDLDEERKKTYLGLSWDKPEAAFDDGDRHVRPRIFLSGPRRSASHGANPYGAMKEICAAWGFDAVSPLDGLNTLELSGDDPLERACLHFSHWQRQLRGCGIYLGDLRDFQGWEPDTDVAFEAGAAWKLGKLCFCYMPDARPMKERIPHNGGFDRAGNIVENFNYPANLMFASAMPIIEGEFEAVIKYIASTVTADSRSRGP
jgi:nucleoside 2-deoxyribosyltransferase